MLKEIKKYFTKSPKSKGQTLLHLLDAGYSGEEAFDMVLDLFNLASPVKTGIKHIDAQLKIEMIISWVNEGWSPDWSDNSNDKLQPIWTIESFSFFGAHYFWNDTLSVVGSLLIYKDREVLKQVCEAYKNLYKEMLIQ